jgi:hypothetical protein
MACLMTNMRHNCSSCSLHYMQKGKHIMFRVLRTDLGGDKIFFIYFCYFRISRQNSLWSFAIGFPSYWMIHTSQTLKLLELCMKCLIHVLRKKFFQLMYATCWDLYQSTNSTWDLNIVKTPSCVLSRKCDW